MATSTITPPVINVQTEQHNWLGKTREAMKTGQEVILLALPLDPARKAELDRLCQEEGYALASSLPKDRWEEFRHKLDLAGYAAKEQGISPNNIYLLQRK
jgi:hypothetical protein